MVVLCDQLMRWLYVRTDWIRSAQNYMTTTTGDETDMGVKGVTKQLQRTSDTQVSSHNLTTIHPLAPNPPNY